MRKQRELLKPELMQGAWGAERRPIHASKESFVNTTMYTPVLQVSMLSLSLSLQLILQANLVFGAFYL
jgi:hypothetical protein